MCAIELEPVITTQRLRLRKARKADAARLASFANDFDVARMTTGMPYPYGVEHAEGFLEKASEADPAREAVFVVDHPEHGAIGVLGFDTREGGEREIGYWIGRPYWGQATPPRPPAARSSGRTAPGADATCMPATSPTTPPRARCCATPASSTPAMSSCARRSPAAAGPPRPG